MSSRTRRIEIVGVAGAGKSTLTRTLGARYERCMVADTLHTRVPAHWPYVVHSLPRSLPLAAKSLWNRPVWSWDEIKFVIYVSEWHRFLRNTEPRSGVTVLDQGPIFALARLLWSRKPVTTTAAFDAWLRGMVERWSVELDAIVRLDARDQTLLERIDHREQRHEAKGKPMPEGLEVVELHREAFGRIFELLGGLGRPRVLQFDTSTMRPAEIASELADLFEDRPAQQLKEASSGLDAGQREPAQEEI